MSNRADWKFVAKRTVRAVDLAILLHNVLMAKADTEIGFEDSNETLDSLLGKMNQPFEVEVGLLESALWSCNMMHEKEKFWHPEGMGFRAFVQKLLPGERFNTRYNLIEEKS